MSIFDSLNNRDLEIWLKGIRGYIIMSRKYAYNLLKFQFTELLLDSLIALNMIFMSLNGIVDSDMIKNVEYTVSSILLVEVILKIYAYNPGNNFFFMR